MNLLDFDEQMKQFKAGDWLTLCMEGPYGTFLIDGFLMKVEDGKVYLDLGTPHSYKKITQITGEKQ